MPTRTTKRLDPTLDAERALFAAGASAVIGCDEVGRGALAGPVMVGMSIMNTLPESFPAGLRDSKLISAKKREALDPVIQTWVDGWALGDVSAQDIDTHGIIWALGEAAWQAFRQLDCSSDVLTTAVVILDGSVDWLTAALHRHHEPVLPVIRVRPKADRDCAVVAAASVIAKVHRDAIMTDLAQRTEYAAYLWESNKGYGSAAHRNAISALGASDLHRRTWIHPAVAKNG